MFVSEANDQSYFPQEVSSWKNILDVPSTLKAAWTISPKMVIKAGEMKLNLSLNALLFRHNGDWSHELQQRGGFTCTYSSQ